MPVKLRRFIYHNYSIILSSILLLFGLYLTSLFGYLLFHGIAEIFGVVVACGIFMVAWNSRRFLDNHYLLFVGIAYLFIALIDLIHTLAYTGMGVFQGHVSNLPTQLWIAARYMESVSLVLAPLFIRRRLNTSLTFFGYVAITAFLLSSIFYWKLFPGCFVEGQGLTSFKKASEYIISLILLISTGLLIQRREAFDEKVLHLLVGSLLLTVGSELFFTFYVHAYGLSNLIGHFFKIISFYLMYRAIIQTGLVRPYDLLFRNLKQSEAQYRAIVEDQAELICRFTLEMVVTFVNEAFCKYFGKNPDALVGHPFEIPIPPEESEMVKRYFASVSRENRFAAYEHRIIGSSGEIRWLQWSIRPLMDQKGQAFEFQLVGRDITEHKKAEGALQENEEKYRSMVEAMKAGVYICSPDLRLTFMNPAMTRRIGRDAVGEPCHKVIYELDDRCPWCVHERVQEGDQVETVTLNPKDNRYYLVSHLPIFHLDGSISKMTISRDITEQKTHEEALKFELSIKSALSELYEPLVSPWSSIEEIAKTVLAKAKNLTGNDYGYVSSIDPSTGDSIVHTLTEMLHGECQVTQENRKIRFHRDKDGLYRGLWGHSLNTLQAFYSNAPETHTESIGIPEGHVQIQRFLSVPVLLGKELVGQIALANKGEDYTESDLQVIGRLAEYYALAIQRMRVEEELRKARDELGLRVLERTAELAEANRQLGLEITEHKRAQETLRKSEKRFRDLVENSPTSIAIVQDDHIVYQNPEQRRLLGSLPRSIVPLSFETVHPDDIEKVRKTYQSLRSGKVRTAEVDLRFTPGAEKDSKTGMKWVHCRASSIEYRGNDAILVNIVDITRAKETERLLRIQDKMTSLGHVATGIAHEIRNPLSGINIYLSTLLRMYEQTEGLEKTREILYKIQSASEKIESVIKRVMDFSKPGEPEFAVTNINKPIEEAIELALVALRKSGVAITKALAADLPLCNADPHMIEQDILNLITNAAEAMKDFKAEKKIKVSSSAENGLIRVTIADSGPGVPEKERGKIFDPFFTTKNGSPGIGLSLSHRIITDHGGTMRVSTSKWGGAEFMIEIPIGRSVA